MTVKHQPNETPEQLPSPEPSAQLLVMGRASCSIDLPFLPQDLPRLVTGLVLAGSPLSNALCMTCKANKGTDLNEGCFLSGIEMMFAHVTCIKTCFLRDVDETVENRERERERD